MSLSYTFLQPFFRGSVPLPPSVNQAYKVISVHGCNRIGPSQDLEDFKEWAALSLKSDQTFLDQQVLNAIKSTREKTPLWVSTRGYFETMWRRDLDGIIKFVVDAAFAHIHMNDNLVVHVEADKFVDRENPRVEVAIAIAVVREG